MLSSKIQRYAAKLGEAEVSRVGIDPITLTDPDITVDEAYHIQLENIKKKLNEGKKIVGKKIGLTSVAVQKMLGVNEPDYGHLLDDMVIENGSTISCKTMLQPKVEGEIAFILKKDLKGPNVTVLDVIQATDYVVPALEIVDSRIQDWKIKLQDTVADNASSGLFVLGGKPTKISDINLELIGMALYQNGEIANTGVGAAALGNPAACVAWLANRLADYDISLKKGEVILSGALSGMVVAKPGDTFAARFAHLGQVSVNFK
ncbi:fumarylacetoacetate hydrolase family protein [Neobacillus drentensis]|uniref:2-keto-4-pentenoate hydratase n=1 Tax=Neobacillus drentensis TaxID=220684 RepID=UPI000824A09D